MHRKYDEAEGFTGGVSQIINMIAQFVGSGLLLFMSYSSLAFVNAFTFLVAGILYLSVGLKHKKAGQSLERQEDASALNCCPWISTIAYIATN